MKRFLRAKPSVIPILVWASALAVAVTGGLGSRHVIDDQNERLLQRSSAEAGSVLTNLFLGEEASLRALNGVAGPPSLHELQQYAKRLGPLGGPTVGLSTVFATPSGFTLGPDTIGEPRASVGVERTALAVRARTTQRMATAVIRDSAEAVLVFAVPGPATQSWVVLHETSISPNTPYPIQAGSPFSELRGSLYATASPSASSLVFSTETQPRLRGSAVRQVLPVGADTFVLFAQARSPLVGGFATSFPWLVFAGGLLAGLLATITTHVLSRRRDYAMQLVEERTSELTTSRAELQGMLTGGPTLVVKRTLDPARVTYVSPNIERLIGHTADDALKDNFFRDHAHPDDGPAFMDALARIRSGAEAAAHLEVRLRNGDGEYRWMALQVEPDQVIDRQVVSVTTYGVDVDGRHRALAALRDANDHLAEANEAKGAFLSRVSHELRTPLNAILGFGQLLEEDATTDEQRAYVGQILDGGRHLLQLVNEVLDLSTLESGRLRLTTETVNPGRLVLECVQLMKPISSEAGITVSVNNAAVDRLVAADPKRFAQVVLNLLSNAIKYNRRGGSVEVDVAATSREVVSVEIRDTGFGIPSDHLERVFVPFERLGANRNEVEGVGVGLALARQLARAMAGDITVTSIVGSGSTFRFELPLLVGRRAGIVDALSQDEPQEHARRVIHIENNLINLRLVEHALAKQGEFSVVPSMSGSLGLELARLHRPELVIVDLDLMDMTAEAMLHELRAEGSTVGIPVVVLYTNDLSERRKAGLLTAGAAVCIQTPINMSELVTVLHDVLAPESLAAAQRSRRARF